MDADQRGPEPAPLLNAKVVAIAALLLAIVAIAALLGGSGGGGSQFAGRAVDRQVESPAYLRVDLAIKNTGDEAGSPECEVSAYIGATRVGYDILDGEEVAPGDTLRGNMVLTIENESAAAVERVEVTDC